MKPDYKNWMPKGMVLTAAAATAVVLFLFVVFGCTGVVPGTTKTVLFIVFLIGSVIGFGVTVWMILMYRAFSYNGKRQMSRQIIEGIAKHVQLTDRKKARNPVCLGQAAHRQSQTPKRKSAAIATQHMTH